MKTVDPPEFSLPGDRRRAQEDPVINNDAGIQGLSAFIAVPAIRPEFLQVK